MTRPAMTAPRAGAAYKKPSPWAPTWRMSLAYMGMRTVAEPKKVAKKSRSMDDTIMGVLNTKCIPTLRDSKLNSAF